MDADLNAFFNMSKDFKRETVSAGYVNGRTVPKFEGNKFAKRECHGTEYGKEYREAELEDMKVTFVVCCFFPNSKNRWSSFISRCRCCHNNSL